MAEKKQSVRLVVGIYDQPQLDKDGNFDRDKGTLTRRTQGETFEAQSQAEYDRLLDTGIAIDPDKADAEEATRLRARLQELEQEKAATEARLQAQGQTQPALNPDDLKGKELDQALTERGLSTDGSADEKRQRLSEHLAAVPSWA